MKHLFLDQSFSYDGSQLKPLFNYLNHGLLGDSILSWVGSCDVKKEFMADGEDLREESLIKSDKMLHFLVEIFNQNLFTGALFQRLMAETFIKELKNLSSLKDAKDLKRLGDDIFLGDKKLNISVAVSSPQSFLIHFAANVTNEGTPVKTLSLEDLDVNPQTLSKNFMISIAKEVEEIKSASFKTKPVS